MAPRHHLRLPSVRRVLTQPLQRRLDPFLVLDAFGTDNPQDYIGGFPEHPHRGLETITYMIAGRMRHRDSAGHEGLLQNGGVQWMTAGRGVIHSELPEQENGRMEGFQLWLNYLLGRYRDARRLVERDLSRFPAIAHTHALHAALEVPPRRAQRPGCNIEP